MRIIALLSFLALLLLAAPGKAADPREYAVEVTAQVQTAPPMITLSWRADSRAREYVLRRKGTGAQSWQEIARLPGSATSYADAAVSSGTADEYEIEKALNRYPWPGGDPSQWVYGHGYILAGINVSRPDHAGKVLLLVDNTVASALAPDLTGYVQDLTGDGWTVIRRDVSRTSSPASVRDLIRNEYNADPSGVRSVILFGHIPVPYSGAISPDMHPSHLGAWPADVYYADVDGTWTDDSVHVTSGWNERNHNVPGDGKFDQSVIPSYVELEIGRIDFHDLPAFHPRGEIDLLRDYLRKNHQFRHRQFTLPRRGLIRDNFGDISGDAPAVDAWRYYPAFFGPNQVREVGPNAFFSTLANESFLWSYAGGGGDYKSMDALGSTGDFATQNPQTAFLILHGSYFGDWDNTDNFLRAAIASGNYSLASIWSGLPHWYLHHMALGETVGYSTRLSQNNRTLYRSHRNFSAGEVHISLIGDPTLRMFPVAPPANLAASVSDSVRLSWQASPDASIVGYHVYYSPSINGPYERLTAAPITSTAYTHSIGAGTHFYMVRAIKLETTGSGTFFNPSQGIFLQVNKNSGGEPPVVTITVEDAETAESGPNPGSFRITRSPASGYSLQVQLSITGTAINGVDYQTTDSIVTIPGGAASTLVHIHPLEDDLVESPETVHIALVPSGTYTIGSPPSAALTIADDQPNTRPTISEIPDMATGRNTPTHEIAFTVGDTETPAANLTLRATSANKTLLPDENLALGGTGTERFLVATPALEELGTAKITLIVSDGALEATRVFLLTVTNLNFPPVVQDQSVETDEDIPLPITITATDPEGASLSYFIEEAPLLGTLSGTPPLLTYTPVPDMNGADSFVVAVSDGEKTSLATISISILGINDPPVPAAQSFTLSENSELEIELTALDPDSTNLSYTIITPPASGVLSGSPPDLVYRPNTNFHGEDLFGFSVSDGVVESAEEFVTLTITPVDDPPVIVPVPDLAIRKNSSTGLIPITLWDSDTPVANLVLSGTSLSPSILGSTNIQISGAGSARLLTATPFPNKTGTALIELRVEDATNSTTALLKITITNTPPLALDDELQIPPGIVRIAPATLLVNDLDADGDSLVLVQVSSPTANGGLVSLATDSIFYTPPPGRGAEPDHFSYTVEDSSGAVATAQVALVPLDKPLFTQIQKTESGVRLRFAGPPLQSVLIEASSDAVSWSVVAEAETDEYGAGDFLDLTPSASIRFYRIEQR